MAKNNLPSHTKMPVPRSGPSSTKGNLPSHTKAHVPRSNEVVKNVIGNANRKSRG